jgi:hypothetical protein
MSLVGCFLALKLTLLVNFIVTRLSIFELNQDRMQDDFLYARETGVAALQARLNWERRMSRTPWAIVIKRK